MNISTYPASSVCKTVVLAACSVAHSKTFSDLPSLIFCKLVLTPVPIMPAPRLNLSIKPLDKFGLSLCVILLLVSSLKSLEIFLKMLYRFFCFLYRRT